MINYITQSWWRTARVATLVEAQADLDRWCTQVADLRFRDGHTVVEVAASEPLLGLPAARFPATVKVERVVAANALVSLWGNRYSVPPGLVEANVEVSHRHGSASSSGQCTVRAA